MKYFFIVFAMCIVRSAVGQISEDFSDGNFTENPAWSGDDSVFTLINVSGDYKLRSNKLKSSSNFYLSTPSLQHSSGQWEFFVQLQFNTSGTNYADIYLTADQSNLLSPTLSGYFVRIGGSTDEISLYRKISGSSVKLIDGINGVTNTSNSRIKVRVKCSNSNLWTLERDDSGVGAVYFSEGSITDNLLIGSAFFGISIRQSSAGFFKKHYLDDIYVGPIISDLSPPQLLSATAVSPSQVDVLFNEALDAVSAEDVNNYGISPLTNLSSASLDDVNASLIHLTLSSPLKNGMLYTLNALNVKDLANNQSMLQTFSFDFLYTEIPSPGDVIINEIMADPDPGVGQPDVEYIEIYNRSTKFFNLKGWRIGDGSTKGTIQEDWLKPGAYKVLSTSSASGLFAQTVPVTSFPSLNNSADSIILQDDIGTLLDKLYYTDQWYSDANKASGGFSLERINPNDPCSAQDNWTVSNASNGGTPGIQNTVFDDKPDLSAPQLIELIASAPGSLEVHFSEGMDTTSLLQSALSISPTLNILSKSVSKNYPDQLKLVFKEQLSPSIQYQLIMNGVSDCWLNSSSVSGSFVLADTPEQGDLVINELLFNPATGGSDWVEVFNTSTKVLDLKGWSLANFDDDTISNEKTVGKHFYLEAGRYAVLGSDSVFVRQHYPASVPGSFIVLETPSYNNDSGTVYLIYAKQVMDHVSYHDDWHFKLLDNTDGISLERLDPTGASSEASNWHSAAESIGFASPGRQNSQFRPALANGDFSFTSPILSPDNDGFEDVLQASYQMVQSGLLGACTIYDDRGRIVRSLFKNEMLGSSGSFTWDGLSDKHTKTGIGTYVAVFEAFSVDGGLMFSKTKAFVVAGKL
jgi:hypothetical protein